MNLNYQRLLVEIKDGICTVTFNDPATLNALSEVMITELTDVIEQLEKDSSVRVVVFVGTGKSFIAGGDISYMSMLTADQAKKYSKDTTDIYRKIAGSDKVFIAAINGYALGGGCEFALGCDLRIASEHAKLGLPEVSLGVLPGGGGTQRLPRLVGTQKALELILTGEIIKADEALRIGLVCKVVPADELLGSAYHLANNISKNSPLAVKYARSCIKQSEELTLTAGIAYEQTMFGLCFAAEDQKEGMAAFLEKRPAHFKPLF